MPRRKAQASLNDKWIKLLSDAEQGKVDPRAAIIGTQEHYEAVYGSNFAAVMKFLADIDARSTTTSEHVTGMRGQLAQVIGNQPIITDHLTRQDAKMEAVGQGLSLLADTFSSTIERLDDWRNEVDRWRVGVDAWRTNVDADIVSFKQSRTESMRRHEETKEHRERLQAQGEALESQMQELLALIYKLSNDIAALKEPGSGD